MKSNLKWYIISLLLIFFDQLTKYFIRKNFALYQTRQITSFLALTYTTNTGTVFGLFEGQNTIFSALIFIILLFLIFSARGIVKDIGSIGKIAICLIFCGGVGNLIDRIFLGKVVDFIDLQWNYKNIWPVFNLADSYVFVGVWIMIVTYFLKYFKRKYQS